MFVEQVPHAASTWWADRVNRGPAEFINIGAVPNGRDTLRVGLLTAHSVYSKKKHAERDGQNRNQHAENGVNLSASRCFEAAGLVPRPTTQDEGNLNVGFRLDRKGGGAAQ
ncbi:hypothetical protein [uncultured Parasphingopyxis sp.]|uniref:hypothetical protein n=1 Tax=uncultured Parasphingopyxis sp. TaxID=1547918 RepID=UPI002610DC95|nr:hypothetical protein [uncultured Parasphingopyxis sp.]